MRKEREGGERVDAMEMRNKYRQRAERTRDPMKHLNLLRKNASKRRGVFTRLSSLARVRLNAPQGSSSKVMPPFVRGKVSNSTQAPLENLIAFCGSFLYTSRATLKMALLNVSLVSSKGPLPSVSLTEDCEKILIASLLPKIERFMPRILESTTPKSLRKR